MEKLTDNEIQHQIGQALEVAGVENPYYVVDLLVELMLRNSQIVRREYGE